MVDKKAILQDLSFGARIAEDESRELTHYFVETDHWRRVYNGEVDIVYGAKGVGKSAVYALLMEKQDELFDRGIVAIGAENPRGTPAFKELVVDPPASELEFVNLWKLYILGLLGTTLRSYDIKGDDAKKVMSALEDAGLLSREMSLPGLVKGALAYVRGWLRVESLAGDVKIDPNTGLPTGVSGKITFREPSSELKSKGFISADALLAAADKAFAGQGLTAWILFDRLDVAFAEQMLLEQNALRALFKVYLDLAALQHVRLKIFIRTDIWDRITASGFREGSHITRSLTIEWDEPSLLNLIVRRMVRSGRLCSGYGVEDATVLASIKSQRDLFHRIFPPQVDPGAKKRETLSWMLSRTADGLNIDVPAPRELIHLFTESKNQQLQKWSTGEDPPEGDNLVSPAAIKDALPEVSRVRLTQTLLSEYPEYTNYLKKLEGEHTQQSADTLAKLWQVERDQAVVTANGLADIGFFFREGKDDSFWVPFLYRPALKMVQGTAE